MTFAQDYQKAYEQKDYQKALDLAEEHELGKEKIKNGAQDNDRTKGFGTGI